MHLNPKCKGVPKPIEFLNLMVQNPVLVYSVGKQDFSFDKLPYRENLGMHGYMWGLVSSEIFTARSAGPQKRPYKDCCPFTGGHVSSILFENTMIPNIE